MSDFILTQSKTRFYPLEPKEEAIRIEDIAHSLSYLARANGHFKGFYSVGQHSVNCCLEARARGYSERVQLGCLLHDASESYISDLTRPVKRNLPDYFTIEEKLQSMIYKKFGLGDLNDKEKEQIIDIDDTLLHLEFETLMGEQIFDTPKNKTIEHDFSQRDFMSVKNEFIQNFKRLIARSGHVK